MRQLSCKTWILASAALGLLLGGATTAYAPFGALSPSSATAERPTLAPFAVAPFAAAPVGFTATPPPLRVGALTGSDMAAIAAEARATGAASPPQYGGYGAYRDAIGSLGGNLHEFYFTRAIYSGYRGRYGGRGSWAIDYPKADIQFLWGLRRLTNIDAYDSDNAVMLTDPDLRRYPFLYMLEVGYMQLTPPETEGLRDYLAAGGFLFIDDFWGDYEWDNFQWEIHKVLPGSEIVELPLDHSLFTTFYEIDEILQVPNVGNARRGWGTSEKGGTVPHARAIFDDHGRLLVLINWNTDLGDAWEWAEDPYYPLTYSNFAYQMAVNAIVYAMSH